MCDGVSQGIKQVQTASAAKNTIGRYNETLGDLKLALTDARSIAGDAHIVRGLMAILGMGSAPGIVNVSLVVPLTAGTKAHR